MKTLIIFTIIIISLLLAPNVIYPQRQRTALQKNEVIIRVAQEGLGKANPLELQKIFESVANELLIYFPKKRLEPITVVTDKVTPRTRCKRGLNGDIVIQLTAKDTYYAKYIYQFSHELSHVLTNYDRDCEIDLGVENQWFEEALGEVASLFVLRQISTTWNVRPPIPIAKGFATYLKEEYAQDYLNEEHRQLPLNTTLAKWYKENQRELRSNPYLRDKDELVANQLLPLFERNPENWESVSYLNYGKPDESNSFQSYLDNWYYSVPTKRRKFVEEVAAMFGNEHYQILRKFSNQRQRPTIQWT